MSSMLGSSDVRDILGGEGTSSTDDSKFPVTLSNFGQQEKKKKSHKGKSDANIVAFKRPEGMHRELYNLLVNDTKGQDVSPLMPTLSPGKIGGYHNPKARLGLKHTRHWEWAPFTNPSRKDGLQLRHWQRIDRLDTEYPFANFNKQIRLPSYSDADYEKYLRSQKWSREETDHLFELCSRFDLRWPVIVDRWDRERFTTPRTMEDMKDRFYWVCNTINTARDPSVETWAYDAEHERRRKEQLIKLWDRTKQEVEEEERLIAEEKKIEYRRKERERKAQDLQKLITAADRAPVSPALAQSAISPAMPGLKKKSTKSSLSGMSSAALGGCEPHAMIRFPEYRSQGPHLRSQQMKIPSNIGQKKLKAVETLVDKLQLEHNPIATAEIVRDFNDLRCDMALLYDLKSALQNAEFELESMRNRYQSVTGEAFNIPARVRVACPVEQAPSTSADDNSDQPTSSRRLTDLIDLSLNIQPQRKRKAADTPEPMKRIRRQ